MCYLFLTGTFGTVPARLLGAKDGWVCSVWPGMPAAHNADERQLFRIENAYVSGAGLCVCESGFRDRRSRMRDGSLYGRIARLLEDGH